ncbi:MAG: hypothetical protein MR880_13520, partial [Negativibacillus massiliensis]|nr:hypothetical protein [Negativibacillus massiliensis]
WRFLFSSFSRTFTIPFVMLDLKIQKARKIKTEARTRKRKRLLAIMSEIKVSKISTSFQENRGKITLKVYHV